MKTGRKAPDLPAWAWIEEGSLSGVFRKLNRNDALFWDRLLTPKAMSQFGRPMSPI